MTKNLGFGLVTQKKKKKVCFKIWIKLKIFLFPFYFIDHTFVLLQVPTTNGNIWIESVNFDLLNKRDKKGRWKWRLSYVNKIHPSNVLPNDHAKLDHFSSLEFYEIFTAFPNLIQVQYGKNTEFSNIVLALNLLSNWSKNLFSDTLNIAHGKWHNLS